MRNASTLRNVLDNRAVINTTHSKENNYSKEKISLLNLYDGIRANMTLCLSV